MTNLLLILLVSFSFSIDGLIDDKQKDIFELVQVIHEPVDSILYTAFEYIFMFGYNDIDINLVKDDIKKIMDTNEYYMIFVPFYDDKFTHSEIKDLLRFYKSDVGRKINSLTSEMGVDATKRTMKYFEKLKSKADEIIGKNKEKYKKKKEPKKTEIPTETEVDEKEWEWETEFVAYDKAPTPIVTIQSNVVYPHKAKSMGIEGTIFVKFFIDEKGNVAPNKISIIKSIPELDEAGIEAVKKSKWKPAQQRDKKVGVYQTIPIKFQLSD